MKPRGPINQPIPQTNDLTLDDLRWLYDAIRVMDLIEPAEPGPRPHYLRLKIARLRQAAEATAATAAPAPGHPDAGLDSAG